MRCNLLGQEFNAMRFICLDRIKLKILAYETILKDELSNNFDILLLLKIKNRLDFNDKCLSLV
jgi:hypothetical protein